MYDSVCVCMCMYPQLFGERNAKYEMCISVCIACIELVYSRFSSCCYCDEALNLKLEYAMLLLVGSLHWHQAHNLNNYSKLQVPLLRVQFA